MKPVDLHRAPKPAKTPQLAAAEAAVIRCLAEHKHEDAARIVALYEADQPVPRGIGVDWRNLDLRSDVTALRSIFGGDDGATDAIRTAAALMYLWGVSRPYRRWLPREANGDTEAAKLVLRAFDIRQAESLQHARERGFIP